MAVWLQTLLRLTPKARIGDLADWLSGPGYRSIRAASGNIWGLWDGAPGLGFRSDEAVLMTTWPDDAAAGAAVELIKACPLICQLEGTPLHATQRPTSTDHRSGSGIWVFRQFALPSDQVHRFIDLSAEGWASFESSFDAEIEGLFRAPDPGTGASALLLLTRYADLATWETSRKQTQDPNAWHHFGERQSLTEWTRARSAVLIRAAAP